MKRKIIELAAVLICFLLQCTFFQAISVGNIVPNLLVSVTSAFGFMGGRKEGMFVGFLSGILMDIFYSDIIGVNALIFLYIGYTNGMFDRIFYPEDVKFPIVLITVSDVVCLMLQYILQFMLRARLDLPYYFVKIMLPEIIYTAVITIILYKPILALNNLINDKDSHENAKNPHTRRSN